jgi:hypothetical protein
MLSKNSIDRLIRKITLLILLTVISGHVLAQSSGGLPPVERSVGKKNQSTQFDNPNLSLSLYKSIPVELQALDQQIIFTNPIGYCTPGGSKREKELVSQARQMLGNTVRLVHVAVKCDELENYRIGRIETLDHWLQIQLIGPKGEFKRIELSREVFLNALAKSSPKLNMEELKKKINTQLKDLDLNLSNINVHQIGKDGNAFYMASRSLLTYGEKSKPVTGLGGVTLINSLPLGVWIYESSGTPQSRDQLHLVLQQAFVSLFTQN